MKTISTSKFEAEVLKEEGPVIVLFEASWCPFCRAFKPIMEGHEAEFPYSVVAVLLDDESDPLWDLYSVEVVPTLAVFESGLLVFRVDGVLGVGLGQDDIGHLREYIRNRSA